MTVAIKLLGSGLSSLAASRQRRGLLPYAQRVQFLADIPYARGSGAQAVDVYLPQAPAANPSGHPYVLFVHGGGWISGDRKMAAPVGHILAGQGIAVVATGYRLAPRFGLSDQAQDLRQAMDFVQEHATQWNLDSKGWAIVGESAGAHLAMRLVQGLTAESKRPRAFIGLYGLYDLSVWQRHPRRRVSKFMLGNLCGDQPVAELVAEHNACRELPSNDVPVLLIHGEADRLAGAGQSKKLAKVLREQGVEVSLTTYPGVGHAFIYMPRLHPKEVHSCYATIVAFLRQHLG